eukprot:1158231-Pelagomonas_calceolata.AAC.5
MVIDEHRDNGMSQMLLGYFTLNFQITDFAACVTLAIKSSRLEIGHIHYTLWESPKRQHVARCWTVPQMRMHTSSWHFKDRNSVERREEQCSLQAMSAVSYRSGNTEDREDHKALVRNDCRSATIQWKSGMHRFWEQALKKLAFTLNLQQCSSSRRHAKKPRGQAKNLRNKGQQQTLRQKKGCRTPGGCEKTVDGLVYDLTGRYRLTSFYSTFQNSIYLTVKTGSVDGSVRQPAAETKMSLLSVPNSSMEWTKSLMHEVPRLLDYQTSVTLPPPPPFTA